jgi:hypothetical protein
MHKRKSYFQESLVCGHLLKKQQLFKEARTERGTLETKNIIVNRELMRWYLVEKVVPAIQEMWLEDSRGQPIFIQQDNAKTRILRDDVDFDEVVVVISLDIRIILQPPNSPDLNVHDLGFFSSIQSLTDCRSPKNLKELIQDVQEEFDGYDVSNLNKIFLTLQSCMIQIMNKGGGNKYSIPHLKKKKLEKKGKLPNMLETEAELVASVLEILGQGVH